MGVTCDFARCITLGPWGGQMGYKWVYMQRGSILKIKIRVYHRSVINVIEFHSQCREGEGRKSVFGTPGIKSSDFVSL
ncbi:putative jacalin-like lectin domain superfamily [Helianthus anomalus]